MKSRTLNHLNHPTKKSIRRIRKRSRSLNSNKHVTEKEPRQEMEKHNSIHYKKTMKCFPGIGMVHLFQAMPWWKKHAGGDMKDDDSSSLDPLAAIIDEAEKATSSKRVRLVRFNLDRNDYIYKSSPPKPRDANRITPGPSILAPSTSQPTSISTTNAPNMKAELNRFIFDLEAENGFDRNTQTSENLHQAQKEQKGNKFKEDLIVSSRIHEMILKGTSHQQTYNYPKAAKYFLQAMRKLDQHAYPSQHKLQQIANKSISDTHHAHRCLEHSANIVKFGLHHESKGQLVKALKMYTVAFRVRKNSLGSRHPSLPVLLNLLGGVQVKRGQFQEAMQIFELALYGKLKNDTKTTIGKRNVSSSTLATSMREIGSIHEHFGRFEDAMEIYHDSLDLAMTDVTCRQVELDTKKKGGANKMPVSPSTVCASNLSDESNGLHAFSASSPSSTTTLSTISYLSEESPEEMEIYLQESFNGGIPSLTNLAFFYDSFFQITEMESKKMNIHVSTTLHNIASIHLKQQEFNLALSAYHAALRGMKLVHGERHESVAAVLGNIGNLLKEIKDYDRAFDVYQSVLKMESLRLGYTHHNVMITMLNMAMIEKCRGSYDSSIALYEEVLDIQRNQEEDKDKKLIVVALSCLGDVYEKTGDFDSAIRVFKEALIVQTQSEAKFTSENGKILHKLGLLCSENGQLHDADTYFFRALRLYSQRDGCDERLIGVQRDKANNLSKLVLISPSNP